MAPRNPYFLVFNPSFNLPLNVAKSMAHFHKWWDALSILLNFSYVLQSNTFLGILTLGEGTTGCEYSAEKSTQQRTNVFGSN